MKTLERRLTFSEYGLRFAHQSRLALLVLPIITPGQPDPTADFAREFADAFNLVILQEGKPAFDFFNGLKKQEKEKIISILSQGGMAGAIYISGDDIFSI
jgi:hypothetical protein